MYHFYALNEDIKLATNTEEINNISLISLFISLIFLTTIAEE